MNTQHERFGVELRRMRQAEGLSLSYLASLVHCSRSYLSRIETGQRRVTYELAELCDIALNAQGALLGLAPPRRTANPLKRPAPGSGSRAGPRSAGFPRRSGPRIGTERPSGYGVEFDRLVRRGDNSYMSGRMEEADAHYREAYRVARGSPRAQAYAVIRRARRWSDPGQVDSELLHLIRSSLAALKGDTGSEAAGLRLRLHAHMAKKLSLAVSKDLALPHAGPHHGGELARRVLARLPAEGQDDETRCEVLAECRWGRYDFAPPAELLSLSERLLDTAVRRGSPYFRGEALVALAIDQLRMGRIHPASATVAKHRKHAAGTGSALARWQQCTLDTLFDLWWGRFGSASDWIFGESREVVALLEADLGVPSDTLQQTRMGQAYWLLREEGRLAELFTSELADGIERHGYFPIWRAGLALAVCETGQHEQAADRLITFADETAGFTQLPPHGWSVPTAALLAEVCAALEAQGGYEAELRQVLPGVRAPLIRQPDGIALAGWPTVLVGPVARAIGLLDLVAGDTASALARFREAVRPASTSPPQMARLRVAQARALLRGSPSGDGTEAARLLRTALATADAYGMAAVARECQALLHRTAPGGPTVGPDPSPGAEA